MGKLPPNPAPRVRMVCRECGGENVVMDGPCQWDVELQEWVKTGFVYDDSGACADCGDVCCIEEVQV